MSEQQTLVGFEDLVDEPAEDPVVQGEAEGWLRELVGEEAHQSGGAHENGRGQFFAEGYLVLRASGWKWREAFCIAWLSLGRDDRGELGTVGELCGFLGVSRMWFYEHKARYDNEPVQGLNAWEWWAERLQLGRLRGQRLADVDEATFRRAASMEGKAADRELYYKRAGVLVQRSEVTATVGQVVDVAELDEAELDALLARGEGAHQSGTSREVDKGQVDKG